MGTYINVLVDHQLADFREVGVMQNALSPSLPAALRVRDYWRRTQTAAYPNDRKTWDIAYKSAEKSYDDCYIKGPGSLFIDFTDQLARIHTGGRWRGFLSIPQLRSVHLQAFHAIASALGGATMVFYPDEDFIDDLFYSGGTLTDAMKLLYRMWGQAEPNVKSISNAIVKASASHPPQVWYCEPVKKSR